MFKDIATETAYNGRLNRYVTAMRNGTPDRIPIRFLYQEAAARHCGVSNQTVACDYGAAFDVTRKMAADMGNDAVMLNAIWSNYAVAKAASWRYLAVPGVDINVESVNQYFEPAADEDAFLQFDEYEEFIDDPTAFLFNKWLSRATTRVRACGAPVDFDHNLALISGALAYANYMNSFGPAAYKLKYEAGVVSANSGMIKAPLDILMDKFRGYLNVCADVLEHPKKVLSACEALMPHILANALGGADPDKNVPITIWAHRGCVPFISPKVFDDIYWPTLKPIFEEIIRQGHQILFYGEGNWERHYDSLLELPAGGIIYHLDKGDPALAAKKLKPKFALSGGVSYDVLARGTPDDVRSHLRDLFAVLKDGGGYILDAGALMLSDIDPQNVKAAADYTMEHGTYSQSTSVTTARTAASASATGHVASASATGHVASASATGHDASASSAGHVASDSTTGHVASASSDNPSPVSFIPDNPGARKPNVCRPWELESQAYRHLSGDVGLVRSQWEKADAAAYNYLWTTVLW